MSRQLNVPPGFTTRTTSGRRVRPSLKVMEAMCSTAEGIMITCLNDTDNLMKSLNDYMEMHVASSEFTKNLEVWVSRWREVKDAQDTWRQYVTNTTEADNCESHVLSFHSRCEVFLANAHCYLAGICEPEEMPGFDLLERSGDHEETIAYRQDPGEEEIIPSSQPNGGNGVVGATGISNPQGESDKDGGQTFLKRCMDSSNLVQRYDKLRTEILQLESDLANTPRGTHIRSTRDQAVDTGTLMSGSPFSSIPKYSAGGLGPISLNPTEDVRVRRWKDSSPLSQPATCFPPAVSTPNLDPTTEALNRLASILIQAQKSDRLPRMEPSVFSGDHCNFPAWWNSFVTLIESRVTSPRDRLHFLGRYTSGSAHECIKGFLSIPDDPSSYLKARSLLLSRFGAKMKVSESYRQRLESWKEIKKGDIAGLIKFSDFLWQCHAAMETIGYLNILNEPDENVRMCRLLPPQIQERWNRIVCNKVYSENAPDIQSLEDEPQYPSFGDFCRFVQTEARIASGPCAQRKSPETKANSNALTSSDIPATPLVSSGPLNGGKKNGAPKKNGNDRNIAKSTTCLYCKESNHAIESCKVFEKLSVTDKQQFAKQFRICFSCLKQKHSFAKCRAIFMAQKKSPAIPYLVPDPKLSLENVFTAPTKTEDSTSIIPIRRNDSGTATGLSSEDILTCCTASGYKESRLFAMVLPILVYHSSNPFSRFKIYACIDSQSDSTFVTLDLMEALGISGRDVNVNLMTMGHRCCIATKVLTGLVIHGLDADREEIPLRYALTREAIPCDRSSIPDADTVRLWPHLANVADALPSVESGLSVAMLIGYDCFQAHRPLKVVSDSLVKPFAVQIPLGWCVVGPAYPEYTTSDIVSFRTTTQLIDSDTVRKAFDLDFSGDLSTSVKVSYDDLCFERLMLRFGRLDDDSHIELPLPIRPGLGLIPSAASRKMTFRRFLSLKRKLLNDPVLLSRYQVFMRDMFTEGYAEIAPPVTGCSGPVWYLPHHGVYHPRKPDKLRVVFDGSMECEGLSLNSMLMTGPDLVNNLCGVLLRFREEDIAFCCDIKAMFLQVRVRPEDRNYLRFFWFEDGDPCKAIREYRVRVHLFGASSSPACSTYALRKVAELFENVRGTEAANFIRKHFYVDDGLCSLSNVDSVLHLIQSSQDICKDGGFVLHKFYSTSHEVMAALSPSIRSSDTELWTPESGLPLPDQVTLGLGLSLEFDHFFFKIPDAGECSTRKQILSALSSLYDPLGFISPVILKGRQIMQGLCRDSYAWDEVLPGDVSGIWNSWFASLSSLSQLYIPRCFKPKGFVVSLAELHVFCDASELGYGACAYVVLRDVSGCNSVSRLVMSKARVMPLKSVTIPRLELQSAVVAAKLKEFVIREMPYTFSKICMWSDSKIVLAYIQNPAKRFHIYVANRVQDIRDRTDVKQWFHVPSLQNPADMVSRGVDAEDILQSSLWWFGPPWLVTNLYTPDRPGPDDISPDDPEIRTVHARCTHVTLVDGSQAPLFVEYLNRSKSWSVLVKAIMVWRRYIKVLQVLAQTKLKLDISLPWTVKERTNAVDFILRIVQRDAFPAEYSSLADTEYPMDRGSYQQRKKTMKHSPLKKLDVFMNQSNVLCVGGRVKRSSLPDVYKHPYLLPKKHAVTKLIVTCYHVKTNHAGRYLTMGSLRADGWWIVNMRSEVEHVISKCIICKKLRGKLCIQKMADLPLDRIECTPPFTFVGVDFFGPFLVKDHRNKRVSHKRWVCLFTCLVLRSVHLEICFELTTDSFLCAYRRFVSKRGPVQMMRSDRGTNLMGAKGELETALAKLDHDKINRTLLDDQCDWFEFVTNPPKASHMGGVWERMIRSVRDCLNSLLLRHGKQLDDEALLTFLAESEAIVNSRPLTYINLNDVDGIQSLSPANLLHFKSRSVRPPPGDFVREDLYLYNRWKKVQYLADEFWVKWRKEYLPLLQSRQKWLSDQPDLQVDDIVLIMDDSLPRISWPLGRVTSVRYSADGHVRSLQVRTQSGVFDRPIHK